MAEQGFDTYGIDFSTEGVKQTSEMLSNFNLKAQLAVGDMKNLPYKEDVFDGVIAFAVLYYNDSKGMRKAVAELYKVLKQDGKALIVTRTTDDYRFGKGKQIETNTFILDIEDTNEQGMRVHFLTKEMVFDYFSRFAEIKLGRNDYALTDLKSKGSNYVVSIKK